MLVKSFPQLFKKNSKGKIQVWDVCVIRAGDESGAYWITTSYGERNGKVQVARDPITEGKNIGRSNETTPEQQAILEAQSSWTYKVDREGYVQKLDAVDEDHRDGVDPMLAHRYDKHPDKMPTTCFTQPKLDGHRCIAVVTDGICVLFSRTRNIIHGVPHINDSVESMLKAAGADLTGTIVLDGELYNHDYKAKFEELTGFIRSETPKDGYEVVQYHLYDMVLDEPFEVRTEILSHLAKHAPNDSIRLVETHLIDIADVVPHFRKFRGQGYEGGMLRDPKSKYIHKRSYGLLKVKEFDDAEFQISGIKEGRGKLKGHAIFVCDIENKADTFDVKLKGDTKRLKEIYQNPQTYIGQSLTVQFQGRTANNIPRFPVGVRLRSDI